MNDMEYRLRTIHHNVARLVEAADLTQLKPTEPVAVAYDRETGYLTWTIAEVRAWPARLAEMTEWLRGDRELVYVRWCETLNMCRHSADMSKLYHYPASVKKGVVLLRSMLVPSAVVEVSALTVSFPEPPPPPPLPSLPPPRAVNQLLLRRMRQVELLTAELDIPASMRLK